MPHHLRKMKWEDFGNSGKKNNSSVTDGKSKTAKQKNIRKAEANAKSWPWLYKKQASVHEDQKSKRSRDGNTNQYSSSSCPFKLNQSQTRIGNKGFTFHLDNKGGYKGDHLSCSEKSLIRFEDGNILENVNVIKCCNNSKVPMLTCWQ